MAFVAWQAYKRRSLALGLVFVAFACQWLPWARIDRATFQYHYYAALPFLLIALAYFLAELRNGPSAADLAAGAAGRGGRHPRAGPDVAVQGTALHVRPGQGGQPGLARPASPPRRDRSC